MTIGAGIGIANFTFEDGNGFWEWVSLCDNGGVDSIWQSDRIIEKTPNLETMSVMAALAGGSKRLKFGMNVASMALRDPVLMHARDHRRTVQWPTAPRLWCGQRLFTRLYRHWPRHQGPRQAYRRGPANHGPPMERGQRHLRRRILPTGRRHHCPQTCAKPTSTWVGGSAPAAIERTARWGTGWQAGIETAAEIEPVITAIKKRAAELNRKIDDDHFGAGFGFRFGSVDDPIVQRHHAVLEKRLGKQPEGYSAVGGVDEMMALVEDFHRAGAHKFILRPIAMGAADMMEQTQLMVEQFATRHHA